MEDLTQHLLNSLTGTCWNKIGVGNHHGIDLRLSSLHTKESCGIGEFYDLCPLIDWCKKLKLDVIQLLPLNSSESDPSPYNAVSSCALNFLNLSLHALPFLDKLPQLKKKLKEYSAHPPPQRVDFLSVQAFKLDWLLAYFEAVGAKLVHSQGLQEFISHNSWVEPYALYKSLKDFVGGSPWTTWPPDLQTPTQKEYQTLVKRYWPQIAFYITLQYLCFCQMKDVKAYANAHGVHLMGDIPILLSSQSADVWHHPECFDIHLGAGAPPDMYNREGQCWGFPIFRWDVLRKNQYSWWQERLQYAANFYDIYRIDHVIGFFRIWAIPHGKSSKEGGFIPKDESLWEAQGREILQALLKFSPMLPIAEDLGTVPDMVRPILQEMGICGTKVMRWERKWQEDSRFTPIQNYPPISLTCVSTHDSETLQLWWKTYPEEAQAYAQFKQWEYAPELSLTQRKEILWDSHHTSSLFHVNLLQEYLALFPELIWPDPEDERINIPGKLLPTNWTYRFRPSVEELTAHVGLAQEIQKILFAKDSTFSS